MGGAYRAPRLCLLGLSWEVPGKWGNGPIPKPVTDNPCVCPVFEALACAADSSVGLKMQGGQAGLHRVGELPLPRLSCSQGRVPPKRNGCSSIGGQSNRDPGGHSSMSLPKPATPDSPQETPVLTLPSKEAQGEWLRTKNLHVGPLNGWL